MSSKAWQKDQDSLVERMSALNITPTLTLADRQGMTLLAHADFSASEGVYESSKYLMLNLCTAHIGRMGRFGSAGNVEGILRPGTVSVALPETPASGYWSKTQMLGIAINLDKLTDNNSTTYNKHTLLPASLALHNDPLLSSVMTAMWRDAELHGMSSTFFEQGIMLLLNRLAGYQGQPNKQVLTYPLANKALHQVLELIESRLSEDVRVDELAEVAKQDNRSFTRSFFAATGFTPYQYFTMRRMKFAQRLLTTNKALTITDIALQVGYANPSKFSAAFKRFFNTTPSNWRNAQ
ncbi:AraC family transcriptional regulator [Colwellia sp. D2M02]|uniref:helix-turn-helix domain-containing protein n=1 Tax=Colwellia sp. D2M02 TaxID=2841562 RepID=UPI001C091141|nr:helix-turn-helix domain-containing protein [Colwellia sp. D2M02]MBU2892317.1 AraC family transcriptional regulator [Colwellia sp. D2M02]